MTSAATQAWNDDRVSTENRPPPFEVDAFREEVREFCELNLPRDLAEKARSHSYFSRQDRVRWQRILHAKGWFAAHWPRVHGGADWSSLQRFVLIEELELAGTPWLTHFGISFAGPLIYTYGTQAQKDAFLEGIRNSDTWWCQGFSEPGAGSDLSAVGVRAVRDGESYVVHGQKAWTTMAQWADMMFALVRTSDDGRPHAGLSVLLIDLHDPNVSVRPVATIDGCHHVNDVFFDDVKVPVGNRVGAEGDGWKCAKLIVANERPLVTELGKARRLFAVLRGLDTARMRHRVAQLEVEIETLAALAYATFEHTAGGVTNHVEGSMLKIRGSEVQQAILEAIVDAIGPGTGFPFEPNVITGELSMTLADSEIVSRLLYEHLHSRATSIYGGSNEIQRHIIAKSLLSQ